MRPVTLRLRALPAAGRGEPPGPARVAVWRALHRGCRGSSPTRSSRPCVFVAGFYGLVLRRHLRRRGEQPRRARAMNVHFLISGYLFYWVVIGVDPTPRPIPPLGQGRDGVRVAAVARVLRRGADGHRHRCSASAFYRSLQLSWHTDLLGDQRLGGGIAWAAGEVPLVVVMIALLIQWRRSDRAHRQATRPGRRPRRRRGVWPPTTRCSPRWRAATTARRRALTVAEWQ